MRYIQNHELFDKSLLVLPLPSILAGTVLLTLGGLWHRHGLLTLF